MPTHHWVHLSLHNVAPSRYVWGCGMQRRPPCKRQRATHDEVPGVVGGRRLGRDGGDHAAGYLLSLGGGKTGIRLWDGSTAALTISSTSLLDSPASG